MPWADSRRPNTDWTRSAAVSIAVERGVPSFEALVVEFMDRHGRSRSRSRVGTTWQRQVEYGISSLTAMDGDKFASHISSAVALNGKHGGAYKRQLLLRWWCKVVVQFSLSCIAITSSGDDPCAARSAARIDVLYSLS